MKTPTESDDHEIELALQDADNEMRARAREKMLPFSMYTMPDFEVSDFHRIVCHYLNKWVAKEIPNLIICGPPQHGKSQMCSRLLPAFLHGRFPDDKIIEATYSGEISGGMGRDVQAIIHSPEYQDIFPQTRLAGMQMPDGRIATGKRTEHQYDVAGRRGRYYSVGVGQALTSRGGHFCFTAGTLIDTEIGKIPIEVLVNMTNPPRVASFDHEEKKIQFRRIKAVSKRRITRLVQVRTSSGRSILCSPEHPVFTEGGYREAALLISGTTLLAATNLYNKEKFLPLVRKTYERLLKRLFELLQRKAKGRMYSALRFLFEGFQKASIQIRSVASIGASRFVLRRSLLNESSCCEKSSEVPELRKSHTGKDQKVLQARVSAESTPLIAAVMSSMWNRVSAKEPPNTLLLKTMCRRTPLRSDGGKRQFAFQGCGELFEMVRFNEAADIGTRRTSLRCLQERQDPVAQISSASYQRECRGQSARESSDSVRSLSHHSPQIEIDTVQMVSEIRGQEVEVYDFEVERNHNYFANEILVHNCIIDDPLKDAKQANSIVYREAIWNWYLSVLLTRMQKKGSILITQTRWHEDDLVGRVLALAKANKDARQWVVLNFEALRETSAEKDTICGHPNTAAKHDRRKMGEALAPFRFDEKTLKQTRETIGPTWWQALYCGRPTSQAGAIIKREWIHFYRKGELPPKFDRYVTSWDFRFKKREESGDFVAGQAWARAKAKFYLLGPTEINERLGFLGSLAAVRQFIRQHQRAHHHLIEKKANGDAIEETLENEIPRLLLVEPQGSKVERLQATEGLWAAGNVLLPHPDECPWILDWIEDLVGFPKRPHDDRVDCASQALLHLDRRGISLLAKLTKT